MPKLERMREVFTGPVTSQHLQEREAAGWRVAAIEWAREAEEARAETGVLSGEVPYGLRVATDCLHLEEDPAEKEVMLLMMERIIQDIRLPQIADELNGKGFRTRAGSPWNPVALFNLLPRLIEVGPRVLTSEEWVARRPRLMNVG